MHHSEGVKKLLDPISDRVEQNQAKPRCCRQATALCLASALASWCNDLPGGRDSSGTLYPGIANGSYRWYGMDSMGNNGESMYGGNNVVDVEDVSDMEKDVSEAC